MLYINCDFYLLFLTFQALPDRYARMQNESEQSFMFHFNAGRMFCARTLDLPFTVEDNFGSTAQKLQACNKILK